MRVDFFDQHLLGRAADDLFADGAALEEKKRGDVVDAELLCELLLVIDVDLHDLTLSAISR